MRLTRLILQHKAGVDDLSGYPNWRIGLSSAASWSWGVSIAVGMAIMRTMGLLPFFVWTFGNILSIPLFGFVRRYLPFSKHWTRFTILFLLFLFVEFFAVTLNLQAIRAALGGGIDISSFAFMREDIIIPLVLALGLAIALFINRYGLKGSVFTDIGQYSIQLLGVVALAIASFFLGSRAELPWITTDGREWVLLAFLGIITGALGTGHQWQRFSNVDDKNAFRVGLWGGFFFGVYMLFVFLSGLYFTQQIVLGGIFLVIVLSVATSTIDSAVAGLQFIAMRFRLDPRIGTAVAVVAIVIWPFQADLGLTSLWTILAQVRYPTVLVAIVLTIMVHLSKSLRSERIRSLLVKYKLVFKHEQLGN